MDLTYSAAAVKDLAKLPKADAERIRTALRQVAESHPQRMPFVTELVGQPGAWRLRKGDWRAIYVIDGETITVIAVTKRSEAYR